MSLPKGRPNVIYSRGAVRFVICPVCNSRLESRLFHLTDAEEEIEKLYREHPCKLVETAAGDSRKNDLGNRRVLETGASSKNAAAGR